MLQFFTYGRARALGKVLVLLFAFAGAARAEQVNILALGDSLTQGYGLIEQEGFVPQLRSWLADKGHNVRVVNGGVSGDTTAGGLARVEWSLTPEIDAMIVALGGNDVLRGIAPEVARANIEGILKVAQAKEIEVLLVGMQAPGNYGPDYKETFDALYPELADQYAALFAPSFFEGLAPEGQSLAEVAEDMQHDGIHPNGAGVLKIVSALGPYVEALIERSGGALKAKVFDSSQLYNARDVGKAVARGDVGMATVPSPYLSRVEANINVLDLPVLKGMTADQRSAMLDGEVGTMLGEKLSAKMGVVVPGNWPVLGCGYYWSTTKPLRNFEEFVGMQIRIPGGAGPAAVVEGMGGVPVVMPGSDMPLALQQGTVDGTMASIESVVQQKLTDVGVRYGFWDQGIVGFLIPVVSQKYWDSLTADEQALFTTVWNAVVAEQREANKAVDAEMRSTLESWGVTISDADAAAAKKMREAMMPQQEKVIAKYKLDETLVDLATQAAAQ